MYGEHRFALAPNEQKAFKGFLDQAFVKVGGVLLDLSEFAWV